MDRDDLAENILFKIGRVAKLIESLETDERGYEYGKT